MKKMNSGGKKNYKIFEWFECFTQESKKENNIVQTIWLEGNNTDKSRN